MGYEIHIARTNQTDISLDEWVNAVNETEHLRLRTDPVIIRNPTTGEKLSIAARPGETDFFDPNENTWIPRLSYSAGRISFRPSDDFDPPDSQFRKTVVSLADNLDAVLIGDDGEHYN